MFHWIYPANTKIYDVLGAFQKPHVCWPIHSKVSVGDAVFIYLSAPFQQIGFSCRVDETNLPKSQVDEMTRPFFRGEAKSPAKEKAFMKLETLSEIRLEKHSALSYENLKANGLKGALMGPRKLDNNPTLLEYIQGVLP